MTPASSRLRKTEQRRSRLRWFATASLLLVAFVVYEIASKTGYLARRQQQEQIEALTQQVADLERENQRLSEDIHSLRSDPDAIEEMAREQLKLARPGEIIVSLDPPTR